MKKFLSILFLNGAALSAATPYMRIEKPLVQPSGDPAYDTKLDTAFNVIDAHDHSDGKGVQLKGAAITGVTTQNFADGSVTNAKLAVPTVYQAGLFSASGGFYINQLEEDTNLLGTTAAVTTYTTIGAVGLTSLGRPVEFGLTNGNSTSSCQFLQNAGSAGSCEVKFTFTANGSSQDFYHTYDGFNLPTPPCTDMKYIVPVSGSSSVLISVSLKGVSTSTVSACAIRSGAIWAQEI